MASLLDRLVAGASPALAHALRTSVGADRLGVAFAAGYQAALHVLVPSLPDVVASLAASEAGGAHPRAIATTLVGGRLHGVKTFATQGPSAQVFLVLASEGVDAAGRARLRLAWVERAAAGLSLEATPPTPFCPEIGHALLRLDATPVREVLPGDGWTELVKPFRTVEDIHVHAAAIAYVLGVGARHAWPTSARAELAALLLTFVALAARPPADPAGHVALAGALALSRQVLATHAALWDGVDADERARWQRDQPLFRVAEKARAARTEAAWAVTA